MLLLQKLTQVESEATYKNIKDIYTDKEKMHTELEKRFVDKEKYRNQQLVDVVTRQQKEILELKENISQVFLLNNHI